MDKWHCYATKGDWGERRSKENINWMEMKKFIETIKDEGFDYFEVSRSYRVE